MLAAFKMKKWQVSTDPHVRQIKKSQVPTGPRVRKKTTGLYSAVFKRKKKSQVPTDPRGRKELQVDSGPPLKGTNYKFIPGRV